MLVERISILGRTLLGESLGDPHGDEVTEADLFVSRYTLQPVQRLLIESNRQCLWRWPPNTDFHKPTFAA